MLYWPFSIATKLSNPTDTLSVPIVIDPNDDAPRTVFLKDVPAPFPELLPMIVLLFVSVTSSSKVEASSPINSTVDPQFKEATLE